VRPFTSPIRPEDVGELLDLTVADKPDSDSMAQMQLEGIAALYDILVERPYAVLADEVGMGKTYQALGLAAVLWNEKPDARVLFISPRENLQVKWHDDYRRFFASNYRRHQGLGDDRAASVLFGQPLHAPRRFNNLRGWCASLGIPRRVAAFLRHTSFTRPVYLTRNDLGDLDALWARTKRRLRSWGLFEVERPESLHRDTASRQLNLCFADALNRRLAALGGGRSYYDLVIIDESQCLRHPNNQSNSVLHRALRGQAARWLFLSATPAHGGPGDLPTILNHYPRAGQVLDPRLAQDLPALQKALTPFLVRRSRRYRTRFQQVTVGKAEYRRHDTEAWGVREGELGVLGSLAMGLVQKGLVELLAGRSNRYRIGFLSSFESLSGSLRRTLPAKLEGDEEPGEDEASGDWHRDQGSRHRDREAPDTGFVESLSRDFEARFERPLPHPKVSSVVDRIAPLAFGDAHQPGGEKFLVFTRRVSTVATLRDRLMRRYLHELEARVRRVWRVELDWEGNSVAMDDAENVEDPEVFDAKSGDNPFRRAMASKGWLFRYRQTFRDSGRNVLFFEDAWLPRVCRAGGVDPSALAARIPDELWAESWTHASNSSGKRRRQHRAERLRYLTVHLLRRHPELLGLDRRNAGDWVTAVEAALPDHLEQSRPADAPRPDPQLITATTLWGAWDHRFPEGPLALPAARPEQLQGNALAESLCKRQVARSLLGQSLRLTDAVLDLYFADESVENEPNALAWAFLNHLEGPDPASARLRGELRDWLTHLRLIVDGCLEGAGASWAELARKESWHQLYNPSAVMGVTGGSGAHLVATRQFRTPSLPRVIVCTDTLKEGVDLHLFCDRVLHYGVAWTSGDLEQRVGRVDRYFSRIERRLRREESPVEARLEVGYPHLVASLERGQVERVIERQRRAEVLMDSPLASARHENQEFVVGATSVRCKAEVLDPYRPRHLPERRRALVAVSAAESAAIAAHYEAWNTRFQMSLRAEGWQIAPTRSRPVRRSTLHRGDKLHVLEWEHDPGLGRYVITVTAPPVPEGEGFTGGQRRRMVERSWRTERILRVLVPTPEEGIDALDLGKLRGALGGTPPVPEPRARELWQDAFAQLDLDGLSWSSQYKASLRVRTGERAHQLRLYAYKGGVRILGTVARLDELDQHEVWGDRPHEGAVRKWALEQTGRLSLGYLGVHHRDGLVFGIHVLLGDLDTEARSQLVQEVADRADAWEHVLTGRDRH